MTSSSTLTLERPAPLRVAAHALGNVLLGLALGLAVYYGVTDFVSRLSQQQLADSVSDSPSIVGSDPERLLVQDGPALDFEGWDAEDRAYWEGLAPGEVFGRIVAPKIGLDSLVVKGHLTEHLKRGPGWIDYTDLPGPTGNVGIAGHRTTYGAPFRRIDEFTPGDTIDVYSPFRRYRYVVAETFQVRPNRVDVMDHTESPVLTLSACDPPYSAAYRLIVRSELVAVTRVQSE